MTEATPATPNAAAPATPQAELKSAKVQDRQAGAEEIVTRWFNARIGWSAVANDPAVLEQVQTALPALAQQLAALPPGAANAEQLVSDWVQESFGADTPVTRDVAAWNALNAALADLTKRLVA